MTRILKTTFAGLGLLSLAATSNVHAFSYVFAGETNGVDVVTHSMGYTGTGGVLNISVGIDPTSLHAADMQVSVQNAVNTWNDLVPTTGNLSFGANNNVPAGFFDFESVVLHELGHALGLGHVNLASESGLAGSDRDYTKSTDGANNSYDIDDGADNIKGSADDLRGDDVNLNYFRTSNNNPFTIDAVVDSSTYSRDTANLPGVDTYSANPDRTVGAALGFADTEGVMQQGQNTDEAQRTLGHDDVAGILYAMAGLDETAGTMDDYVIDFVFDGLTDAADIVLDFDNIETSYAETQVGGAFISADHVRVTTADMFFNSNYNWFFNDVLNESPAPILGSLWLAGLGLLGLSGMRRKNAM